MSYIPEINKAEFEKVFRTLSKKGLAFLKASVSKGDYFDPNRNIGYEKNFQSGKPFSYIFRPISANSLIWKEIGLQQTGAVQILVSNQDVDLLRLSIKVEIEGKEYYAYSEAVGNRFQVFDSQFGGYSRVILFLRQS